MGITEGFLTGDRAPPYTPDTPWAELSTYSVFQSLLEGISEIASITVCHYLCARVYSMQLSFFWSVNS